jgi:hypothetical protein
VGGACTPPAPPKNETFERSIAPILTARCTISGGGACHVDDGSGRAMGNLELSSYEAVTRRPDVLRRYGPYPYPLLLMKAVAAPPQLDVPLTIGDVAEVPLFLRHVGGPVLKVNEPAFMTLQQWLEGGATRTGLPPPPGPAPPGLGECVPDIRTDLFAQTTLDGVDLGSAQYRAFQEEVWPVLRGGMDRDGTDHGRGCLGRECHGARDSNRVPTLELYFTCGDDDLQRRFNYLVARTYSGAGGRGQLSEKPLAGGAFHAGGKPFLSPDDPGYRAIRDWSAMDAPFALLRSEGQAFFDANVQPVLAARGCYLEACHSLVNFNFYKPLAGTDGMFGTRASLHNYLQARFMLGLESLDPREGRLLGKNLFPTGTGGIVHRGGPILEPEGGCDLDLDAVRADPTRRWLDEASAACVVATWHKLERAVAVEAGELDAMPGAVGVFVRRPPNRDRHIDFATYRPGADLLRLDLVLDGDGRVTGLAGPPISLLSGCGVAAAERDVRRPDISADGAQVIFAMRTSAAEGLDLWRVQIDGSGCARLGLAGGADSTGTPLHHFDPAYGPGGIVVFASTRGDADHVDPARRYPARTTKHFLPASNIWVFFPGGTPRRLSFPNGSEFAPRLLHTRDVVYAVEKAAPDFYQISTRAVRLDDGTGYLPRLGQRPTVGYGQIVEMRELADFRSVFIASDPGTYFGGGTLGVQDLSLGLEELSFTDLGFVHPTEILDPGAAARPGVTGAGAYRSPTPLPDGRILVAYSPGAIDLGDPGATVDYGLWVVDPDGVGEPWLLHDTPGAFDIEPVVAYRRIWVPQPNRFHQGDPLRGEYIFHSLPVFASLLNANTRRGTAVDDRVVAIRVLESMPPPDGTAAAADVAGSLYGPENVYVRRRLIGEAPLFADGSARLLVPAHTPLLLELLDRNGDVIDRQREEEQIGAGETQPRIIPASLFNAVCGGCHNALDGSELGVSVGPDVITGASNRSEAALGAAVDLYLAPDQRVTVAVDE